MKVLNGTGHRIAFFLGLIFITAISNTPCMASQEAIEWNNKGVKSLNKGDNSTAVTCFTRAINMDPGMFLAWYNRGLAYLNMMDPEKALSDLNRALQIRQDHADAYLTRGDAYSDLGKNEEAIKDYSRAISLSPEDYTAYSSRGIAYLAMGKDTDALSDFSQALKLKPDSRIDLLNRGITYMNMEHPKDAILDLTSAIQIHPGYAKAYYYRSGAFKDIGRMPEALLDARQAAELDPANERFQEWLRSLEEISPKQVAGRDTRPPDEQEKDIRTAKEPSPGMPMEMSSEEKLARLREATAAPRLKDEERFAGQEEDALAEFRHEAAVRLLDEYRRSGAIDKLYAALNSAGEAIKLHSEKAEYWITLGDVHSEMSKFNILRSHEYSMESYEQALALDPDNAPAMVLLGVKLAEGGEYREALDNLERAVETEILVLSPNVLKWMNICYLNGAQTKRGTLFFDRILKDHPDYFYLHLNKAILYRAHFDYKSARMEIVQILNNSRADENMQEQAIRFLSELKEPDETGQGGKS